MGISKHSALLDALLYAGPNSFSLFLIKPPPRLLQWIWWGSAEKHCAVQLQQHHQPARWSSGVKSASAPEGISVNREREKDYNCHNWSERGSYPTSNTKRKLCWLFLLAIPKENYVEYFYKYRMRCNAMLCCAKENYVEKFYRYRMQRYAVLFNSTIQCYSSFLWHLPKWETLQLILGIIPT